MVGGSTILQKIENKYIIPLIAAHVHRLHLQQVHAKIIIYVVIISVLDNEATLVMHPAVYQQISLLKLKAGSRDLLSLKHFNTTAELLHTCACYGPDYS